MSEWWKEVRARSRRRVPRVGPAAPCAFALAPLLLAALGGAAPAPRRVVGPPTKPTLANGIALQSYYLLQAGGQNDPLDDLQKMLANLDRAEDIPRRAAFIILQPYLPPGTRMTSGYRSKEEQFNLIRRMAASRGIDTSGMTLSNRDSWIGILQRLRGMGYIVASPDHTPHSTPEIVFDMAGKDISLDAIWHGCEVAQSKGMVKFRTHYIERTNYCVHVEVESLSPKALAALGGVRGLNASTAQATTVDTPALAGATPTPSADDDARARLLQELRGNYQETDDPERKKAYDLEMLKNLDPRSPNYFSESKALEDDIRAQEKASEELEKDSRKKAAKMRVEEAAQEGRLDDAEKEAEALVAAFPEEKNSLITIRARRLVAQAIDALVTSDCDECGKAGDLADQALRISPDDTRAQRVKRETETCLQSCRAGTIRLIFIVALVVIGLAIFVYVKLRPRQWVLEVIEGDSKGRVFLLAPEKTRIGALEGECDIVINDRAHKISRLHCVVRQLNGDVYLKDKSNNGTKLNGERVKKERYVILSKGDKIALADEAVLLLKRTRAEREQPAE